MKGFAFAAAAAALTVAISGADTAPPGMFNPTSQVEWAKNHDYCCGGNQSPEYPLTKGDRLGRSTAGIGDLDLDGYDDIVVAASRDNDGASRAGALYVLYLNGDNTVKSQVKISNSNGGYSQAPSKDGNNYGSFQEQDRFGYSSGLVGDIDGDGVQDICAGADGDDDGFSTNTNSKAGPGAVYILFMNRDGTVKAKQKISNSYGNLGAVAQLEDGDAFGQSCAGVNDMNGDGIPDLAVGAPGRSRGGALFTLYLNADGSVKGGAEISSDSVAGISSGDSFGGRGVNNLGDLDGDGRDELIVGAYGSDTHGAAYILYFDAEMRVRDAVKISSADLDITTASSQKKTDGAQFGHSLAALGDVTGDGIPDVAISANNEGVDGKGAVYLLSLNADASIKYYRRFEMDSVLPEQDRLCRSMSLISSSGSAFTIACGAGASSTGDVWALSFASETGESATSSPTVAPEQSTKATLTLLNDADGGELTYCRGGNALSSNWDHSSQTVTGPLTLEECTEKCISLECSYMTVKAADGRCILKSECSITTSTEGSSTYMVSIDEDVSTPSPTVADVTAKPTSSPTAADVTVKPTSSPTPADVTAKPTSSPTSADVIAKPTSSPTSADVKCYSEGSPCGSEAGFLGECCAGTTCWGGEWFGICMADTTNSPTKAEESNPSAKPTFSPTPVMRGTSAPTREKKKEQESSNLPFIIGGSCGAAAILAVAAISMKRRGEAAPASNLTLKTEGITYGKFRPKDGATAADIAMVPTRLYDNNNNYSV